MWDSKKHSLYYPTPFQSIYFNYFLCPAEDGVADFLEDGGIDGEVGTAGISTFFSCFGFFVSRPLRAIEVLLNRINKY